MATDEQSALLAPKSAREKGFDFSEPPEYSCPHCGRGMHGRADAEEWFAGAPLGLPAFPVWLAARASEAVLCQPDDGLLHSLRDVSQGPIGWFSVCDTTENYGNSSASSIPAQGFQNVTPSIPTQAPRFVVRWQKMISWSGVQGREFKSSGVLPDSN